jgi:hypothetical protein
MSLRWLRLAAVASVAGSSTGPAAPAASGTAPADLAKLQELIKELEPVTPVVAPNRTVVQAPPRPMKGPSVVPLKSGAAGGSNADTGDDSVLVFEEAEKSVERALRRLAPSPGPLIAGDADSGMVTPSKVPIYYCTQCTKFFNGAEDTPGSKMCMKKAPPDMACYSNINGCPADMTEYTCAKYAVATDSKYLPDLDEFLAECGNPELGPILRGRGVSLSQVLDFAAPMGTFLHDTQTERRSSFAAAVPLSDDTASKLFACAEQRVADNSECTVTRVVQYLDLKKQVQLLMTKLVGLKRVQEEMLATMVDDFMQHGVDKHGQNVIATNGTCPCYPVETAAKAMAVPGF